MNEFDLIYTAKRELEAMLGKIRIDDIAGQLVQVRKVKGLLDAFETQYLLARDWAKLRP